MRTIINLDPGPVDPSKAPYEVGRITGGYYFSPDTKRAFKARVTRAVCSVDGVLYVLHSSVRWGDEVRLYKVTAFTENGCSDLSEYSGKREAERAWSSVVGMGCQQ